MSIEAIWIPGEIVTWRRRFKPKPQQPSEAQSPVARYAEALRDQTAGLERVVDALLCQLATEDGADLHGLNGNTRRHAQ